MSTKISQLTQLTAPANADYVPIVQASSSTTKYILLSDLMKIATAIPNNTITGSMLASNTIKLGSAQITADFSTVSTTAVAVTGLTASVTIPAGGRSVKISAIAGVAFNSNSGVSTELEIWDGTVGTGTLLNGAQFNTVGANATGCLMTFAVVTPAAGSKTYNVGMKVGAGTGHTNSQASYPSILLVELI